MEPMGVAHNILERIDVNGKEVLVIGCGPVGLLCCSVAKVIRGSQLSLQTFAKSRASARTEGPQKTLHRE